jgi:ankyrin repeat protein
MDEFKRLLNAAIEDNVKEMELETLTQQKPEVLFQTTEGGNTCLHIASLCGHKDFCTKVLGQKSRLPSVSSLLSITNNDRETPMLVAVKSGNVPLARYLITECHKNNLNDALLRQDRHGCTVLHHAIRNGYEQLALDLISQQPGLPGCCNNREESPMFMAVMRGLEKVYMALLDNETSIYTGARRYNALHAAVKYGNEGTILTHTPSVAF